MPDAARIAIGDPLFTQGTLRAEEALRPWRRKVAIVARFAFPVNNAYTIPPNRCPSSALAARRSSMQRPRTHVGTIVVRLGDREVARVPIDFSRIE
jgi:hypothetical protein